MPVVATRNGIGLPKQLVKPKIPDDLEECRKVIEQFFEQLEEKDGRIEDLMQQVQLLLRARYGRKAETVNLDQLRLFGGQTEEQPAEEQSEPEAVESVVVAGKGRHGRRKPAAELPRIRVEYTLSEVGCHVRSVVTVASESAKR